jgi:hypothetical protein
MGVPETSTHERDTDPSFLATMPWKGGMVAGLAAAFASAVAITVVDASVLADTIAGLYGFEGSLPVGWVAHLVHGTLFGLVFAAVLSDPIGSGARKTTLRTVFLALVYGLVLAVAGAGVLMPVWLDALGIGFGEPLPRVSVPLVIWHGVYGLVLGVTFAWIDGHGRHRRAMG